jgi:hypothetical protein
MPTSAAAATSARLPERLSFLDGSDGGSELERCARVKRALGAVRLEARRRWSSGAGFHRAFVLRISAI